MTARGAAWSFAPAPFRDTNHGRHVDAWGPRDRTAILARVVAADACRWVRLFFVGGPGGFCERHGKSYLTRRRRGEEGGGGGSVTGGTVPSV